jgi:hypothetical protein
MTSLPSRIADLVLVFSDPKLLSPEGVRNPLGPFHTVAAWRAEAVRYDEAGWALVDGYDLIWHWSPDQLRGRVYFGRFEPKGSVEYWRDEVVFDLPAGTFSIDAAVLAIARHHERHALPART